MLGRTLLWIAIASGWLGCHIPIDSPKFEEKVLEPSGTFEANAEQCHDATKAALDAQGYEIRSEQLEEIVTGRRKFTYNMVSQSWFPRPEDPPPEVNQVELSDQLWVELREQEGLCSVRVAKLRFWNGIEELRKMSPASAKWTREHIVEALYREIGSNL